MSAASVRFIVTGFGPFSGIDVNPTEQLVRCLSDGACEHSLHHTSVLTVSAEDADIWVQNVDSQLQEAGSEVEDSCLVFLHLGVGSPTGFKLEQCAYNEASFRCPDQRGLKADKQCINAELPLVHTLETDLDLQAAVTHLKSSGFEVEISKDPGRFICNWIYFRSLALTERSRGRWHSLFVHVPSFSAVEEAVQRQFLAGLMNYLAASVLTKSQ